MPNHNDLRCALAEIPSDFRTSIPNCGGCIVFSNTPMRGTRKYFTISLDGLTNTLDDIIKNQDVFISNSKYQEKKWRVLGDVFFTDMTSKTMINVQTKPFYVLLNKITHVASGRALDSYEDNYFNIEKGELEKALHMLNDLKLK